MCHIAHEIGSDKPTSAGHDDVARLENLTTHHFRVPAGSHSSWSNFTPTSYMADLEG